MNVNQSMHSVYLLANEKNKCHSLDRYRTIIQKLNSFGQFLTYEKNPEWLSCYAQDSQHLKALLPLLVFKPHDVASVKPFINACYEADLPIQVRGGGTSLSGASIVAPEGVILLTGHLNRILDYDSVKGIVKIEPGVTCHQLNQYVQNHGWEFPLEMATSGVAGLGGCLSSQAKGYHQGSRKLYSAIISASLIDGTGEMLKVPGSLLCGAEGMFGVIAQLEIQLSRIPQERFILEGVLTWDEITQNLDLFKQYHSLQSLCWYGDKCQFLLEGESWRVNVVSEEIQRSYPRIFKDLKTKRFNFSLKNHSSIALNCTFPIRHLSSVKNNFDELLRSLGIESQFCMEVLSGSLYILLKSQQPVFEFLRILEQFMVLGIEIIENAAGRLFSAQAIGKLWQPYLTPFFGEEDLKFLSNLKCSFDPKRLFCRDHFFPEEGKCLVRTTSISH